MTSTPGGTESAGRIQETQFTSPDDSIPPGPGLPAEESGVRPKQPASYGAIEGAQSSGRDGGTVNATQSTSTIGSSRALAPDLLRGFVMVLQAIDHASVSSGAWRHGMALESESDGQLVDTWNITVGWIARLLTHLCAPAFMFLLGMGVVYFGRSRGKLGWSNWRMVRHFAIRALVLAIVNEVLGLIIARGRILIMNIVLLALAVNYFLAGLLWLLINASEKTLATVIDATISANTADDDSDRPLLQQVQTELASTSARKSSLGSTISWHLHNLALLALTVVTIWWNKWLSPDNGHCHADMSSINVLQSAVNTEISPKTAGFFDFWFYPVHTSWVLSGFPPLAWLSFAILGMLYARVVLARSWSAGAVNAGNAAMGVLLAVLFVITRVSNFGNLSEGCLHMSEHEAHPDKNQYLTSFRAFFYVVKYPPSPAYFAYTMSANFFLLALFGALPANAAKRLPGLLTFGTSALFFYVLHLVIYSIFGMLAKQWFGHTMGNTDPFTGEPAIGIGNSPAFWVDWVLGLALLYPACRWYSRFKSSKGPNSIWRFF